ncbi:MAG: hypothetical protein HC822_06135 [Oscillochloris sp.]|nr:hypothetical protein [Oscillochloris sp.]
MCSGADCPTIAANGRSGQALSFSGQQALAVNDGFAEVSGFTIAAWINGSGQVYGRGQAGNAGFVELSTNRVRLQGTVAACDLSFAQAGAGWYHLAASYDGANITAYGDGVQIATTVCAAGPLPAADSKLGGLTGSLDEVHLFDRGLAADEVAYLRAAVDRTWLAVNIASSGAETSGWNLAIPAGLDGAFVLQMRAADTLGNRTVAREGDLLWRGMIDTAAPQVDVRVVQRGSGILTRTTITCRANDFNLNSESLSCPAPNGTILEQSDTPRFYEPPLWRQLGIADSNRLMIGRTISYVVDGSVNYTGSAEACDTLGRCTTATPATTTVPAQPIDMLLTAPGDGRVLTSLVEIAIAGAVRADAGLATLDVQLDGASIYTNTWGAGTGDATFSVNWTPPAEGRYELTVIAIDQNGREATETVALFVDTAAPTAIGFSSATITLADTDAGALTLPIQVSDTGVITAVQASPDGILWLDAVPDGARWRLPINQAVDLDAVGFSFDLRAFDAAGRSISAAAQNVTVDVTPPAEAAVTLSSGGTTLAAGDVVRTPNATLRMSWPTGSDAAGPVTFLAGWTTSEEPDLAALTAYGAGSATHDQVAVEGQVYYAHLAQIDSNGNQRVQSFGPITADSPFTPDAISLVGATAPEQRIDTGWMNSECTLVGQNSALARKANAIEATTAVQQFFTTWDDRALRMAWRGTIWGDNEDLFIYLDTVDGGATSAYTDGMPAGQPEGRMPSWFEPDMLLRVDDAANVALLSWNGAGWAPIATPDAFTVWFGQGRADQLEIYLPFNTLNISDPANSGVGVLAYATEEDSLKIWSVMPANNPLSSSRVLSKPGSAEVVTSFEFTDGIFWENLAAGVCPSAGQMLTDVRFSITAEPVGSIYSLFNDESFGEQDNLLDGNDDSVDSENLDYFDNQHPPLFEGQVITYTIHYENVGEVAATNLRAWLINWGALQLPDGELKYTDDSVPYYEQFVPIGANGSVAPGESGTVSFVGVVDRAIAQAAGEDESWATVDISFHDDSTGLDYAIDWFFADHPVDVTPPEFVYINEPWYYTKAGQITVEGFVWDESPVPAITIEVQANGQTRMVDCSDATPDDGEWTCPVDLGALADGTLVALRARATDDAGLTSEWSAARELEIDATAPALVLTDETASRLAIGAIGVGNLSMAGQIVDDRFGRDVEICVDRNDGQGALCQLVATDFEDRWSYDLPIVQQANGVAQEISLTPIDWAGNRGTTMRYSYVIDTVAPTLTASVLTGAQLAQTVPATNADSVLIGGNVSDTVGVAEVSVRVERPDGTVLTGAAELRSGNWSYRLALTQTGIFRVYVEARDTAGNVRTAEPLLVGGPHRLYLPLISR